MRLAHPHHSALSLSELVMSSDKGKSGSGFWSMVLGVGVGTVFGAALGVAWVLGHRNPTEEARQNRRTPASSLRPSVTRSQLPKRHFKFLFSKDHKISNDFKAYLTDVFNLADSNKDGGLSPEDLQSFVLLIRNEPMEPQQLSWYFSTFETNADGHLTLSGFLKSYEWPLSLYGSGELSLDQLVQSYKEEVKSFGCTLDNWVETD